jgi:hypothetical protein
MLLFLVSQFSFSYAARTSKNLTLLRWFHAFFIAVRQFSETTPACVPITALSLFCNTLSGRSE